MPDQPTKPEQASKPEQPWSVPIRVQDVPEAGRTVKIEADAATRADVARLAGVVGIDRLSASFELEHGSGERFRVIGEVRATVRQTCIVTLEPLTSEIEEPVEVDYAPPQSVPSRGDYEEAAEVFSEADPPEPLTGGAVDLGAVATEFLILGIDPYPRKEGAAFAAPSGADAAAHPFAALAALKKKGGNVKE